MCTTHDKHLGLHKHMQLRCIGVATITVLNKISMIRLSSTNYATSVIRVNNNFENKLNGYS